MLEPKTPVDPEFADFVEKHRNQLDEAIPFDEDAWFDLYTKINSKKFGADGYWDALNSTTKPIKLLKEIPPHTTFVFPHTWTFRSAEEASQHITAHQQLHTSLSKLILSLDIATQTTSELIPKDAILNSLFKIAYQYQVYSPDESGKLVPMTYYYVSLDADFIKLKYAPKPLLSPSVFIDLRTSQSYTLLTPPSSFAIPKSTLVTRGSLTPMPSFASSGYWDHHYANSPDQYEWFISWDAIWPTLKRSLPKRLVTSESVVLNLGCGNSNVGQSMVRDKAAQLVVNIDISAESIKDGNGKGEEFVVLDGTKNGLRNGKFDYVFDKGTLDGILYHENGVQLVKQIFKNMESLFADRGAGRFVLVSLGLPENRMRLIEEVVGGWEVESAFELKDESGESGKKNQAETAMKGGTLDVCYIMPIHSGSIPESVYSQSIIDPILKNVNVGRIRAFFEKLAVQNSPVQQNKSESLQEEIKRCDTGKTLIDSPENQIDLQVIKITPSDNQDFTHELLLQCKCCESEIILRIGHDCYGRAFTVTFQTPGEKLGAAILPYFLKPDP
ncbi:hypothetical protein HK098_004220 [Nowakowskiella sp. JEL0407]|nr:hypothetical protein HK098_004220 [Nowakowskiella sp. JEL0407]